MGLFDKMKAGLKKTREAMSGRVELVLHSFTKIDEDFFEELEESLILCDIGAATSAKICGLLRGRIKETGEKDPAAIRGLLKGILGEMLAGEGAEEPRPGGRPCVVLVIGVNGVGKTTTIGKLAARWKSEGKRVLLGAADTFRAAAIGQLQIWADRAGVELVRHGEGADPAAVVYDTLAAGKARGADVILIDTAGRLHNKKNLMDELAKISRVIDREAAGCQKEVLLVLDATTGQNGVNQAREFKEAAGITGIVLTKLDGTAKGGIVVAIRDELGLPVKYVGVGEQLDDLQPFAAEEFVEALFDGE